MKYLVLGGSGLVGHQLVLELGEGNDVHLTYHSFVPSQNAFAHKLELQDHHKAAELVKSIRPDVVIHTVANPSVDWHERERTAAYNLNVLATAVVAGATKEIGAKMVYLSTAFVFPDIKKVFSEDDIPAPISFYGVTKLGGELAASKNPDHLIIRTDQIYGWTLPSQKKSFVVGTLEKLERGEKVEVCRDWFNVPTYVKDLSAAILSLIKKDSRGVYHIVGSSFVDRYSWAIKIAEVFGKDKSLVSGINSEKLNLPAKRPNVHLSNTKVINELGMKLMTVEEGLEDMKSVMK